MAEAQAPQNSENDSPEIWIPPPDRKKKPKIDEILKIYNDVIDLINQDVYDNDLKRGLALALSADVQDDISAGNQGTKPNYLQVLEMRIKDLKRMECGITITGDTSSGKTSLVNKLVGQRLVTPKVLAATSKICRIRNSETYAIEVLDVDGKVLKERMAMNDHKQMNKKLDRYTGARRDNAEMYYIDIYCPFRNLDVKGNVMLVDTPGISGAREMNSMLMEFLPNAFGFIFVIDVSRAGGVEEDRLLAILQSIAKARYMMPCFEPDDVLFVINKWNMLRFSVVPAAAPDDSDDEEGPINEEEEIWNTIVNKVKSVWPTLKEDQIFRINLFNEHTEDDTDEERNEFRRFARVLSQLLEETKNKKVEMHLSLLCDTICNIDLGIQSRIHTATSDDENMEAVLKDTHKSLKQLLQNCKDIVTELQDDIKKSVEYLSEKMHAYINSADGKNEILNPNGEEPINDVVFVSKEVPKRIQEGVRRWMKGRVVFDEIEKIDGKIMVKCENVRLELEKALIIVMGKEVQEEKTKLSTVLAAILTAPLWVPLLIVIGTLIIVGTIVLSPFIVIGRYFFKEMKKKEIDALYIACTRVLTKAEIRKILVSVFKDHFDHRIKTIFEKELPRKIATILYNIEILNSERTKIKKNLKRILSLRDSLCKIKSDLENIM